VGAVGYIRMVGACLVTMIVVVAVMTGSASAKLPEWGKCQASATHEGRYADAGCTEPVRKVYQKYTGGYEWSPLLESTSGNDGAHLQVTEGSGVVQAPVSIELKDGYSITCSTGLLPETEVMLRDATSTTAPDFAYGGCINSEGKECVTAGAANEAEINDENAWRKGFEKEPGSWTGKTMFIEGRRGSTPAAGIVYKTEEPRGRFFQQIVCEGEAVHAFVIGGDKRGEELTTEIQPVNTMTEEYTAILKQSGGVQLPEALERHATKPLEALVNGERWETIGIEATMVFPQITIELPNSREPHEVELKATP
jgi:hypothetical protein